MSRRLCLALALFFLYAALIGWTPLLDSLVFFPSTNRIAAGNAARRVVAFEGGELEIWTAASRAAQVAGQPDCFILRFYGNADRAERWVAAEAEMFNDRAVEVWGMNYPGFGGSTGPARLARVGPAALAAFDELRRTAGDHPVVLFGASLGTTAALHVSAHREVSGLILHNPPVLREMIVQQFGWWNLWLLAGPLSQKVPAALNNVANAKATHAPGVFLLAEKDEVVAPKYQALVVDAYAGPKRVISLPGAGHNSPIAGAELAALHRALDWLFSSGSQTQMSSE
ncbi:MAG: alpha/beta fold hydrolase [Chthoniobacterales bacterium]|nr:alpha/beta fold hydrolase [Chthoniobacterales bacterium]